jgi:hypothetical protein
LQITHMPCCKLTDAIRYTVFFSRCKCTMLQSNITSGCKQIQFYSLVAIRHIFIFSDTSTHMPCLQTTKKPMCNHTHAMLQTNTNHFFAN